MPQPTEMSPDPDSFSSSSEGADLLSVGEILVARAYLYELWHKLFATAPDAETLDALLSEQTGEVLGVVAEGNEVLEALSGHLAAMRGTEDRAALLKAVRGEYTRSFIGPAEPVALPFASPYKTRDRAVFQMNTVEVRRWYRRFGLEPAQLLRIPDDHVAIICAFCAHQAQELADAFLEGDAGRLAAVLVDQLQFVPEHVNSWAGDYAYRMRASETALLYPQLVEAFAAFAKQDEAFLAGLGMRATRPAGTPDEEFASQGPRLAEELEGALQALRGIQTLRPANVEDCELRAVGAEER